MSFSSYIGDTTAINDRVAKSLLTHMLQIIKY